MRLSVLLEWCAEAKQRYVLCVYIYVRLLACIVHKRALTDIDHFLRGKNKFMCRSRPSLPLLDSFSLLPFAWSRFVVKIKRINVIYFTLFAGRKLRARATSIEWKYISFIFSVDIFPYPFHKKIHIFLLEDIFARFSVLSCFHSCFLFWFLVQ